MPLQRFLRALREHGDVVVSASPPGKLDSGLASALEAHEAERRLGFPPGAPDLDVRAACWGVRRLYEACQFLVLRDAPAEVAHRTLTAAFPDPRNAEIHYSVDLGLSYLPSLFRLAERIAPDDPLLEALKQLASEWPLSSVGMPGVQPTGPTTEEILGAPFLHALYLDRILDLDDPSRLVQPRIRESARSALGGYPELRPRVHAFLLREAETT